MHARVTLFRIRPGKLEEFTTAVDSLLPTMHRLEGFRTLLVLRGAGQEKAEATTVSVWDTLEALHKGDNNVFYNQALTRLLGCCDGFPTIREQEVLLSEFVTR